MKKGFLAKGFKHFLDMIQVLSLAGISLFNDIDAHADLTFTNQ